jgi:molybdopterin converting factor subunit 1
MRVHILLFATLRDRIGGRESVEVEIPPDATVRELKTRLAVVYPGLAAAMPTCIAAIDREFAFDPDPIPDGAEIALFPPVSGG